MAKHGKNTTANPIYTNYERRRDAKESGFGTQKLRLGADSARPLECCSLTNQRCTHPVISNEGYIFEKEAILEYMVKQKKEIKEKLRFYRKQLVQRAKNGVSNSEKLEEMRLNQFFKAQSKVGAASSSTDQRLEEGSNEGRVDAKSISNMSDHHQLKSPAFWLKAEGMSLSSTQEAPSRVDSTVKCPITKTPLKMSHLCDVVFSWSKDKKTHICPLSGDVITSAVACALLKTTGNIITQECVNNLIKRPGDGYMICPFTGKSLDESDIIPIKVGGTAFSASNKNLVAKISKPVLSAT